MSALALASLLTLINVDAKDDHLCDFPLVEAKPQSEQRLTDESALA